MISGTYKHSDEAKKKIIESNKRRFISAETRKKMSESAKNKKPLSIEHRKKISKANSGSNNHFWIDGRTPQNRIKRHSFEIRLWRKSCMERDNFTCAKTGKRGGNLEVHHINNFIDFPELQTCIENGITLSKKSHIAFHKKYGYNNNTKEQLEDFLNN